ESGPARHQTGNNSGVVHSGLYYKPGSLKATNCINGYHMLIDFCEQEGIAYELCGKIVVATRPEQVPMLETLYQRGTENGLKNLKYLGAEEMSEIEPHVAGIKGIKVPQTGIIDYKKVSEKYAEKIQEKGGQIRYNERVYSVSELGGVSTVVSSKGSYETTLVVHCGGVYYDKVAQMTQQEKIDLKI